MNNSEKRQAIQSLFKEQRIFKELIELFQKGGVELLLETFKEHPEALDASYRLFFATVEQYLLSENGEIDNIRKFEEKYDLEYSDFYRAEHHLIILGVLERRYREKEFATFTSINNGFYLAHRYLFKENQNETSSRKKD